MKISTKGRYAIMEMYSLKEVGTRYVKKNKRKINSCSNKSKKLF